MDTLNNLSMKKSYVNAGHIKHLQYEEKFSMKPGHIKQSELEEKLHEIRTHFTIYV